MYPKKFWFWRKKVRTSTRSYKPDWNFAFQVPAGSSRYYSLSCWEEKTTLSNRMNFRLVSKFLAIIIAEPSCAHRSTMGNKIWLSMHPKKFWFWRKYVRTSTPSYKPDWNFAFQVPAGSAVNRIATRTFEEKTTIAKPILSSDLNFNVYIDVDNRERARARDKKQRRPISS